MSVSLPIKKQEQARIPNSQYVKKTASQDGADTKPAEPVSPEQPETK